MTIGVASLAAIVAIMVVVVLVHPSIAPRGRRRSVSTYYNSAGSWPPGIVSYSNRRRRRYTSIASMEIMNQTQ